MAFQIKVGPIKIKLGNRGKAGRPGLHKADGQKVYNGMDSQYQDAKGSLKELKQLKAKVQNNPNIPESDKRAMLANIERGIDAATEALDFCTKGGTYDTTSGSLDGDADMGATRAALMDAHMAINEARDDLRMHSGGAVRHLEAIKMDPPVCQATSVDTTPSTKASSTRGAQGSQGSHGASSSGAAGASGGSRPTGTTELGAMEVGGKTVDEMMEMMSGDPQGLMDHLSGLSTEDRQLAMQMLMQRLQEINQMFSMMSNMQKSAHDTAKASINNMRV